jgi:hypothetical protein
VCSQESILLEDILCCLEGAEGDYIFPNPLHGLYEARTFSISESVGKCRIDASIIFVIKDRAQTVRTI